MKKVTFLCLALLTPIIAFAQFTQTKSYIASIGSIVQMLTVIVMGLALLYFFWGLAKFILAAGDEKKIAEGKSIMIWGIIALFVMASVWGLVAFVGSLVGVQQGQSLQNVPGVGGLNR